MKPALDLLSDLVACPSPSGEEAAIAALGAARARDLGLEVERVGHSLLCHTGLESVRLLLVSHLDTVPVGEGWTCDPMAARWEDGRLVGRGANDAKASAAAMLWALAEAARRGEAAGVAVALNACEETTNTGMADVLRFLAERELAPEMAVVGEPTGLEVVRVQGGLAVIEAKWEGRSCHAAHAHRAPHENALIEASRALAWFGPVRTVPIEGGGLLGPTTIVPTVLSSGERHNVVPDTAKAVFDCRLSPPHDVTTCIDALRAHLPKASLSVRSDRLRPVETPDDHPLVEAALAVTGRSAAVGSNTMSDMALLPGTPAIKCGPGESVRSHQPDEFVTETEFIAGCRFYLDLIDALAAAPATAGDAR